MSQVEQKKKKIKTKLSKKEKRKAQFLELMCNLRTVKGKDEHSHTTKKTTRRKLCRKAWLKTFLKLLREGNILTAISLKVKVCKKRNTLLLTAPRRSNFPRAFSKDRRPSTFISSLNIYYTNKGACFDKFIRACMLALFVHKHYEKRKATALMCTFQT